MWWVLLSILLLSSAEEESSPELSASCKGYLDEARQALAEFYQLTSGHGALAILNQIQISIDNALSEAGLLSNVHPDEKIRELAETCQQEVSALSAQLSLSKEIFDILLMVSPDELDQEAIRFLDHSLRDFRRSGVDKDEETRGLITQLLQELVLIGQDFGRNIREDSRSVQVTSLAGLPADYVDSHPINENGTISITTDYPDFFPFMTYAEDPEARKSLMFEFLNRGHPNNEEVMRSMLAKRDQLAKLLGYPSFAAYVVEDKMIKTPENIQKFLEQLWDTSAKGIDREYQELLDVKRGLSGAEADSVESFEKFFLEEKTRRQKFGIDSQDVRSYLDYEKVKQGLLDLTAELYGLTFHKNTEVVPWHESVDVYDVKEGDVLIGRIHLDMHPRPHKYGHAAQFGLKGGVKNKQIPEGVLVCNFADPKVSSPALMNHDQVVTFFHEFGHLMHYILGGQDKQFIRFSGTATEWDFVETPSQLYEEWAWDHEVLKRFAVHHETNEAIPLTLVQKMKSADEFGKALDISQHVFYSSLSLHFHNRDPKDFEPLELQKELQGKYSKLKHLEGTHFYLNFEHLDGYSAMVYTYAWSRVIAKDLFTVFKKEGLLNQKISKKYVQTILKQGGVKDASQLVVDFLGREYSFDAFQDWIGSEPVILKNDL